MHPAHPLEEGAVTVGAGFSGNVPIPPSETPENDIVLRSLEEAAVAPGLAPWVGGRYGIDGDFDAGIIYSGRAIRLDARRAFVIGEPALSVGLGLSGLLPRRDDDLGLRVGGFGGDVPLLIGVRSRADVYALWLGVRGGAELLRGERESVPDPTQPDVLLVEAVDGWHAYAGGLIGLRIGFRYIFATLELDAAYHWAGGTIGETEGSFAGFTLTPAGAIVVKF
jgi:hypothetical protein